MQANKMKKVIALILILLLSISLVAGCGSPATDSPEELNGEEQEEQLEEEVWDPEETGENYEEEETLPEEEGTEQN